MAVNLVAGAFGSKNPLSTGRTPIAQREDSKTWANNIFKGLGTITIIESAGLWDVLKLPTDAMFLPTVFTSLVLDRALDTILDRLLVNRNNADETMENMPYWKKVTRILIRTFAFIAINAAFVHFGLGAKVTVSTVVSFTSAMFKLTPIAILSYKVFDIMKQAFDWAQDKRIGLQSRGTGQDTLSTQTN